MTNLEIGELNNSSKTTEKNKTTTDKTNGTEVNLKRNIEDQIHRESVFSKTLFEKRIASEWLSTKQAAYYLSLSENALRICVHRGKVPASKFGSRLRFRFDDLKALLQGEI
jgi:excisionase family DNA binding protein